MKTHLRKETWSNSKLVSVEYLCTRDEYLEILKTELKEIYRVRFETECPVFKQLNADNGLLDEIEANEVKMTRTKLLNEYNRRKELLESEQDNDQMELIVRAPFSEIEKI